MTPDITILTGIDMQNIFIFKEDAGRFITGQLLFYDVVGKHYYQPHSQNFINLTDEEECAVIRIKNAWEMELAELENKLLLRIEKVQDKLDTHIDEVINSLMKLRSDLQNTTDSFNSLRTKLNSEVDDGK